MSFMVALSLTCGSAMADDVTIIDHITADSVNVIVQPIGLDERLSPQPEADESDMRDKPSNAKGHQAGYRIQVFSDNNPRTAKNEANSKARTIRSRFPQYRSYVSYKSPYWRLKVGDFRTQQEANAAAADIRRAFPSYGKEIRIVKDRVFISD